jgi:CheY-like chemotaxis protein
MQKKILIIEDNESYLTILTQKLNHTDFEVITANDGQEGLEKVLTNTPDLVLIDLLLPKMNGIQVIEEIRKSEAGKSLPVLILTNLNPDPQLLQSIEKNKPANYLIKPEVTTDEIIEKIQSVLPTQQHESTTT